MHSLHPAATVGVLERHLSRIERLVSPGVKPKFGWLKAHFDCGDQAVSLFDKIDRVIAWNWVKTYEFQFSGSGATLQGTFWLPF